MTSQAVARWATLAAGLICSGVAWAATGTDGLAGAAAATVVVVAFMSSSVIPMLLSDGANVPTGMGLAILLMTYTLRLVLALAALVLLGSLDAVDGTSMGLTVVATALTWISVQVWFAIRKSRTEPTVEPS